MKLYIILVYILLFTQAPIPGCLDGIVIDSRTILVTMYYSTVVMLGYDWWLCMVINISVQYSGGILPDIILLTQGYYQLLLLLLSSHLPIGPQPYPVIYVVANPVRGHKKVPRSTGHIMVTTRYSDQ